MKQRDSAEMTTLTATRARTRSLLIDTAMNMFDSGAFPSITEVAQEAQLSRATAYRYFPTQSALVSAIVTKILSPISNWRPAKTDVGERIDELLAFALPGMLEHEGTLRAALYLSLTQWAQSRNSCRQETENLAREERKLLLQQVVEPLNQQMSAKRVERVIQSLSLVYGPEIFLVMKDIWGCSNHQLEDIAKWIAKAIVHQAHEDEQALRTR